MLLRDAALTESSSYRSVLDIGLPNLLHESGQWGVRDLNPRPTDYESAALTG